MGKPNFSDEFKRDAVAQITERGYPVAEVSQRLGVSQHSLYAWKRQLAKVVSGEASKDAEIRQLKRELARVYAGLSFALNRQSDPTFSAILALRVQPGLQTPPQAPAPDLLARLLAAEIAAGTITVRDLPHDPDQAVVHVHERLLQPTNLIV